MREARFRPFSHGDIQYLSGVNLGALEGVDVEGFSVDYRKGRFWYPVGAFGICSGPAVGEDLPGDWEDPQYLFLFRRDGEPASAHLMASGARKILEDREGVVIALANESYPGAARFLQWLGFKATGLASKDGFGEYVWQRHLSPWARQ